MPDPLSWFIGLRPAVVDLTADHAAAYVIPTCTGPSPQIAPPLFPVRSVAEVLHAHGASAVTEYVVPDSDLRYTTFGAYRTPLRKIAPDGSIRLHLFPAYRST